MNPTARISDNIIAFLIFLLILATSFTPVILISRRYYMEEAKTRQDVVIPNHSEDVVCPHCVEWVKEYFKDNPELLKEWRIKP